MKKTFLLLIVFCSLTSASQTKIGTSFRAGYDRIGLFFDQTLNFDLNNNQFDLGLRYYGPDYVFEKDIVGFSIAYSHNFQTTNEKLYFGPGVSGNFFHENKTSTEFYLSDFMAINKIGYNFGSKFSIFAAPGFGMIVDKINSYFTGQSQTIAYFNYEFSIGLKYYWRSDKKEIDE